MPLESATEKPTNSPTITLDFGLILDRFGYLDERKRGAKHWLDEHKLLTKVIQDKFPDHPADQPLFLEGTLYQIDLTMREEKRKVTSKSKVFSALKKALGLEKLAEALSYTFTLIDQHIPPADQKLFAVKERTGPRDVRAALKVAPQAA